MWMYRMTLDLFESMLLGLHGGKHSNILFLKAQQYEHEVPHRVSSLLAKAIWPEHLSMRSKGGQLEGSIFTMSICKPMKAMSEDHEIRKWCCKLSLSIANIEATTCKVTDNRKHAKAGRQKLGRMFGNRVVHMVTLGEQLT